jgi:outer membrane protein TolC
MESGDGQHVDFLRQYLLTKMSGRWVAGVCSRAGVLAAALLLAGCAVGPDFLHPASPGSAGYTKEPLAPRTSSADAPQGQPQRFVIGQDISGEWWTLFRSPPLNALVQQALNNNPSLQTAMANLRAARQAVYAQEGKFALDEGVG